jgi:acetylornithine/N-succinyldiaminopimelate aminotransferase
MSGPKPAAEAALINPRLAQVPTYPQIRLEAAKKKARAAGRRLFDLGIGDPLEPTPPFIRQALLDNVPTVSQYPSSFGSEELRQAIAAYLERVFEVRVDADQEIFVSAGSKEAVFHAPLALLDPTSDRRGVLFGDPGYPIYDAGTRLAGGEPIPVALTAANGHLIEPEALPRDVVRRARILWLCYPHNPTGTVADRAYLARIARFAEENDIIVCADECYVELAGAGRAPSMLEVARTNVLVFHSLSKRSGMTGYRSGFVAGDPALIASYRRLRPLAGTGSPDFVQKAAVAAWSNDAHVADRRRTFEQKRAIFRRFFEGAGLTATGDGALYIWVQVPGGGDADAYAERLVDAGVIVAPGTFFGAGAGYVRVALVPTLEDCQAAVTAWKECL